MFPQDIINYINKLKYELNYQDCINEYKYYLKKTKLIDSRIKNYDGFAAERECDPPGSRKNFIKLDEFIFLNKYKLFHRILFNNSMDFDKSYGSLRDAINFIVNC